VTGWDRPVDPVGDCRFDRRGDRLTVTVPGKGRELDVAGRRLNAPRLLRDVRGDFMVQVRVEGRLRTADMPVGREWGQAGLLLASERDFKVKLTAGPMLLYQTLTSAYETVPPIGPRVGRSVWIRLERRGDVLWLAFARDGKKWKRLGEPLRMELPHKLKVGVVAENTAEGTFKAVFDQFRLTPLGRSTR
jgi:regulation of enolase protein 1 (concanavalin A-like superfamily)